MSAILDFKMAALHYMAASRSTFVVILGSNDMILVVVVVVVVVVVAVMITGTLCHSRFIVMHGWF